MGDTRDFCALLEIAAFLSLFMGGFYGNLKNYFESKSSGYSGKAPRMIALYSSSGGLSWGQDKRSVTQRSLRYAKRNRSRNRRNCNVHGRHGRKRQQGLYKGYNVAGTAAAVVATNYPAFSWVDTYDTTYADKLGGKTFAWYMPSIAELCEVYRNRSAIDASFAKIRSLPNGGNYADEKLANESYCSSSQDPDRDRSAWGTKFSNGEVTWEAKFAGTRVCCLSGF